MKKIKPATKLMLSKMTVADLNSEEMDNLRGGTNSSARSRRCGSALQRYCSEENACTYLAGC